MYAHFHKNAYSEIKKYDYFDPDSKSPLWIHIFGTFPKRDDLYKLLLMATLGNDFPLSSQKVLSLYLSNQLIFN